MILYPSFLEWDVPGSSGSEIFDTDCSHDTDDIKSHSQTKRDSSPSSNENVKQFGSLNKMPDYRILSDDQKVFCIKHPRIFIKQFNKSNNKSKSGRSYDTIHACFVCGKLMTNIQKHIENSHRNEKTVKKIRKLKK